MNPQLDTALLTEVQELTVEVRRRDRLIISLLIVGVLLFSLTLMTALLGAKASRGNNRILTDLEDSNIARTACLKIIVENKPNIPGVCQEVKDILTREKIIP